MSLSKRTTVTPAMVAANRANAQKSTGPRTAQGRNRIVLNVLKHGQHASNFRENLLRAKSKQVAELFQWILDQVHRAFQFRAPWQLSRCRASMLPARAGGTPCACRHPAERKGASEASSAECLLVGAGLDPAAAGRARNKPGICCEINR
jgi:hypothetical protein